MGAAETWATVSPRRTRSASELQHRANAVLELHQLKRAVDLVKAHAVRDERVDVDIAPQVAIDQLRHLVAALDPTERRPTHSPPGDQHPRHDVQCLALAG